MATPWPSHGGYDARHFIGHKLHRKMRSRSHHYNYGKTHRKIRLRSCQHHSFYLPWLLIILAWISILSSLCNAKLQKKLTGFFVETYWRKITRPISCENLEVQGQCTIKFLVSDHGLKDMTCLISKKVWNCCRNLFHLAFLLDIVFSNWISSRKESMKLKYVWSKALLINWGYTDDFILPMMDETLADSFGPKIILR